MKKSSKKAVSLKEIIEKQNKRTEKKNAKFNALPKMQQRVEMGKEVLRLLKTRKIKAERNIYFEATVKKQSEEKIKEMAKPLRYSVPSIEWQKLLPNLTECRVCALGVGAIASINLRGNVRLNQVGYCSTHVASFSGDDCHFIMEQNSLFTPEETRDMERFFENYSHGMVTPSMALKILWGRIIKDDGVFNIVRIHNDLDKLVVRRKKDKNRER